MEVTILQGESHSPVLSSRLSALSSAFTTVSNNISLFQQLKPDTVKSCDLFLGDTSQDALTTETLKQVYDVLQKQASLRIFSRVGRAEGITTLLSKLKTELVLTGFVVEAGKTVEQGYEQVFTASKAGYPTSGKLLKKQVKTGATEKKAAWKLIANDLATDYELEDEEALLDGELETKLSEDKSSNDCGPGEGAEKKKRACKNCSCGLKEMIEAEEKGEEATMQPSASSCGNCAKGDAFRCSGCPYLGLPKFAAGTKPEIKLGQDGTKVLLDMSGEFS